MTAPNPFIIHHSTFIVRLIVRRCEPLTTFGAAALEHELAAFCAHTHAKAVSLSPAAVVGLKGPLHCLECSSKNVSVEKSKRIERTRPCQGYDLWRLRTNHWAGRYFLRLPRCSSDPRYNAEIIRVWQACMGLPLRGIIIDRVWCRC